jgi:hypothetical protein
VGGKYLHACFVSSEGVELHIVAAAQVPAKWDNILKQSQVFRDMGGGAEKTPPKTPPRSTSKA